MKPLFFLLGLLYLVGPVYSQSADSLFLSRVAQVGSNHYSTLLDREAPIYNGRVYAIHGPFSDQSHPFFLNGAYIKGAIGYKGLIFNDVEMMYDLIRDQLVLLHLDKSTPFVVIPEPLDFFSLHNHKFVYLKNQQGKIREGYYDLLYDGKIKVLAKRAKTVLEKITQSRVERTVVQQDRYFVLSDSTYTTIRSKSDLLKLLRTTHNQNHQFIKANRLNFKRDKENAILKLVQFHDSIVSQ